MSSSKQDGPKLLSSRSSILRERSDVASASFRVYYSHGAGTVPFVWEARPGTPKSTVRLAAAAATDDAPPPISLPPSSHQSRTKEKCTRPRGWMLIIRRWLSCAVAVVHRS